MAPFQPMDESFHEGNDKAEDAVKAPGAKTPSAKEPGPKRRSVETHIGVDYSGVGDCTYYEGKATAKSWTARDRVCVIPNYGTVEHYGEDDDGVWLYRKMG